MCGVQGVRWGLRGARGACGAIGCMTGCAWGVWHARRATGCTWGVRRATGCMWCACCATGRARVQQRHQLSVLCTAATVARSSSVSLAWLTRSGDIPSPAPAPVSIAPASPCTWLSHPAPASRLLLPSPPTPLDKSAGGLSPGSCRAGRPQQPGVHGAAALTAPYFTAVCSVC